VSGAAARKSRVRTPRGGQSPAVPPPGGGPGKGWRTSCPRPSRSELVGRQAGPRMQQGDQLVRARPSLGWLPPPRLRSWRQAAGQRGKKAGRRGTAPQEERRTTPSPPTGCSSSGKGTGRSPRSPCRLLPPPPELGDGLVGCWWTIGAGFGVPVERKSNQQRVEAGREASRNSDRSGSRSKPALSKYCVVNIPS